MLKLHPQYILCVLTCLTLTGCGNPDNINPTARTNEVRVISLAPSLTEIVFAIGAGDCLVGRTSACDYPPESVSSIPVIGGFGAPSLELVLATQPTLIIDTALADETIAARINRLGIKRERINCQSVDDIPTAIEKTGQLLKYQDPANQLAAQIRAALNNLQLNSARHDTTRPSVYVEIWHDPLTTAGRRTFLSELINLAGGRNIGDEADEEYFKATPEWVVSRNPDIILCAYMARDTVAREMIRQRGGWQNVNAVKNGAIYDRLDNDLILRPGPRLLEGVALLRKCFSKTENK